MWRLELGVESTVGVPGLSGRTAERWGRAGSTRVSREGQAQGFTGGLKTERGGQAVGQWHCPTPPPRPAALGPAPEQGWSSSAQARLESASRVCRLLRASAGWWQGVLAPLRSSRWRAWRLGSSVLPFLSPGAWGSENSPQMLCASGLGGPSLSPQDNPKGERGPRGPAFQSACRTPGPPRSRPTPGLSLLSTGLSPRNQPSWRGPH